MKKVLLVIILLFFTSSLLVASFNKKSRTVHYNKLTLKQVQEDFYELTKKIETGVPEPFYHSSKSIYDSVKNSVYHGLKENITTEEVFRLFYPLIQCLNDAHFSLHLPESTDEKISYFPLRIFIHENRLFVLEDFASENHLNKGEEIQFINGISAREIINSIKGTNYKRKSNSVFFENITENVFHKRLYSLFGFKDTFEVKTTNNTYTLKGISSENFIIQKPDHEFKILNRETGYLKINNLAFTTSSQRDSLTDFLEKNLGMLNKQPIKKLIVDIRGNLGGSSVLAKDILDYFTDTPYTLSTGVNYFHKGKHYYSAIDQMHTPAIKNKFNGKVILISDVLTYSSAHMMQVGFKHFKMGITIGQESSESLHITGEIKKITLKNSKIELISPTVNFRLPGYRENHRDYYIPDHVLYPSLSDRLENKDIFLKKALEL